MDQRIWKSSTWPALVLLVVWLVLAGSLTWQRSRESVVPPIWDQEHYVLKAEGMWTSLMRGKGENPFNIEPSIRPPGTVLLTAPLGPLKDVRNFYFRSVFIPVVIMAFAVFIAGVGVTRRGWESALVALLASSMPMFWQFEIGPLHYTGFLWGLVDTFQASLAALAMASLLFATVRFERLWTIPGLLSLALLPLVKPSGFVLGGMVSLAWLAVAIRHASLHPRSVMRGRLGSLGTSLAILLVLGGVALASFRSAYFSTSNINLGKVALAQLRGEYFNHGTIQNFSMLLTGSIGIPLLIAIALLGGMDLLRRKKRIQGEWQRDARWLATIGIAVFLIGIILTYQATLFRQARYFFPVLAITTVLLTPIFVAWINRASAIIYTGLSLVPLALLSFLAIPSWNVMAYSVGGYGLFTGYGREEVRAAKTLIDTFQQNGAPPPVLFSTADGVATAIFESAFVEHLRGIGISDLQAQALIHRPFSWVSGGVIKIADIYNADILLLERDSKPADAVAKPRTELTFTDEMKSWRAWLEASPATGSTKLVFKTQRMLALLVKDRSALEQQMRRFIASRRWRPEFLAANEKREFAAAETPGRQLPGSLLSDPVVFGNAVRLHALSILRTSDKSKINLSIYTERIENQAKREFAFFIHQLDGKGRILSAHPIPLVASRLTARPIALARDTVSLLPRTTQLGVGIYEPAAGTSLLTDWTPDHAVSEEARHSLDPEAAYWKGRRISFAINSLPLVSN